MAAPDPATEAPAPLPAAGLLRRLAALFYDLLLLTATLFIATALLLTATGGEAIAAGNPLFRAFVFLLCYLYFAVFWLRGGQTLGMKTWRLRLVRADGLPLRVPDTMMRFAVGLLSAALAGLGFLWALVDRDRRTWHDRAAGTRLVRLPKPQRRPGG